MLSGAVRDPRAINELILDWKARGALLNQTVTDDLVRFLGKNGRTTTTPSWPVLGDYLCDSQQLSSGRADCRSRSQRRTA